MIGVSQYWLGDQPSARLHIERALAHDVAPLRKSEIVRFQVDHWVTARAFFARILWLQGFPDQAMREAESSVADGRATNHAISLCLALAVAACLVALWVGDLAAAEHYGGILLDHSTSMRRRAGASLPAAIRECSPSSKAMSTLDCRCCARASTNQARPGPLGWLIAVLMAEALGRAGQIAEGLAAVEVALTWTESTEERWAAAELLRIKGELLLLQGAPGAAAPAKDHFRQALDWARQQGALSWELRAATSLARLLGDQDRSADATALLQPVYDRFTEGFATADLKAAKALLDDLS
jgi:hypothetical protein